VRDRGGELATKGRCGNAQKGNTNLTGGKTMGKGVTEGFMKSIVLKISQTPEQGPCKKLRGQKENGKKKGE